MQFESWLVLKSSQAASMLQHSSIALGDDDTNSVLVSRLERMRTSDVWNGTQVGSGFFACIRTIPGSRCVARTGDAFN